MDSRHQFSTAQKSRIGLLIFAAVTGALAILALFGYDLVRDVQGEYPPGFSPYATVEVAGSGSSLDLKDGPILLLVDEHAENPFGIYLSEILRAEGLNAFDLAYVSDLATLPLQQFDIILLAEGTLNDTQAERLEEYVAKGGRLVAMRPDARLAAVLGVELTSGSTSEGYLQVDANHTIAAGIAAETLQFHGDADHYRLVGAQAIAWLASDRDTRTDFPAVSINDFGQGQAALWAFDLARSVAYTRQGNPSWANQERDGFDFIRVADMFKGWVDLDRMGIPQADEQQRLLANLLSALSQEARPLPRLWYFPEAAKSMLIATGDAHQNPASAVEQVLAHVEARDGHMTIYYAPHPTNDVRRAARKAKRWVEALPLVDGVLDSTNSTPSQSQVADWRARGHEFAIHPYVGEEYRCGWMTVDGTYVAPGLEESWRRYWEEFTGAGYGPVPPTARTHCILWKGWVETARVQTAHGIRMNLDYYHVGPAFRKETGKWVHGHFTGSGLPMKFVDQEGRVLDIYQQLTQLTDEHLLNLHWGGQAKLSAEEAVRVSETLLRRSLEGAYSAVATNFHVDPFAVGGESAAEAERWLEGTLDFAVAHGIPIWSAKEWLRFTEVRHDADLGQVQWHLAAQSLSFRLTAQSDPNVELTLMVPMRHGEARLVEVEVDGQSAVYQEQQVGGVTYGWFSVQADSHQIMATYE